MGSRGPAPTPTAILAARGSWRANIRPGEPEPPAPSLRPPKWISEPARKLWRQLAKELADIGVFKATDRHMLAVLCETYATWRATDDDKAKEKWTGVLLRLAREFGLTPSSRSGLIVDQAPSTQDKSKSYKLVG